MTEALEAAPARRPLVPLAEAASLLARICDDIDAMDGTEPIPEIARRHFDMAGDALAASVDEVITFRRALDGMVLACEQAEKSWRARRRQLEEVRETHSAAVMQTLKAEPGLPYRGSLGALKVQKNGGIGRLVTQFLTRETKSISNVIDPETVAFFGIEDRFIEQVVVTRLNTDEVRAALKDGPLPWAKIEKSERIGGW